MTRGELIGRLVVGSIRRAIQEGAAAVLVVLAFGFMLTKLPTGSPPYYGCLVVLVASGFIAGVVWSYALSFRMLRAHPESDDTFWREAFLAQARLLRLVPLWYLAPLGSGVLLCAAPASGGSLVPFLVMLGVMAALGVGVTWLNRRAADQRDAWAQAFVA